MAIGERMTSPPRYIKHPVAGSDHLRANDPLDAGSAMIISNNLAQMGAESLRHLVTDAFPRTDTSGTGAVVDGYNWAADAVGTLTAGLVGIRRIAWTRLTATPYALPPIVCDRQGGTTGQLLPRRIRCWGEVFRAGTVGAPDAEIFLALTLAGITPSVEGAVLASYTRSVNGAGVNTWTTDLAVDAPLPADARQTWRARESFARGNATNDVVALTLWYGTRVYDTASLEIMSFCAWEVP